MPKRKDYLPEFEAPKKKLLTEHEQYVKALYQAQSNVSTTLQGELQKGKLFKKSAKGFCNSEYAAGTSTLKQLKEADAHLKEVNDLLNLGLTQDEVSLYHLYIKNGLEHLLKEYPNHEPELLRNKIDAILEMINKQNKLGDALQEESITRSILPMEDVKLLDLKIRTSINAINDDVPDINKIRRKARKFSNRLENKTVSKINVPQEPSQPSSNTSQTDKRTFWDKTDSGDNMENKIITKRSSATHSCERQNYYTIKNGEIVKINDDGGGGDDKQLLNISGQMSLDDIKAMPQFANYKAGNPSNVIYIKNMPKKASVDDLKHIFSNFPATEYKVMSGKLRGQAFMTFDSVEAATKMLADANGFICNGKAVVLQFGRGINKNS